MQSRITSEKMIKILKKVQDKPQIQTTWWILRLGLASLFAPLLGVVNGFFHRVFDLGTGGGSMGLPTGFFMVVIALVFSISAIMIGTLMYKRGERSWVLWIGLVPALLVALFWTFMVVGEILFPH